MRASVAGALATREGGSALIPSLFLSDGYSLGDVHTGSNAFAWATLDSFATVQNEVLKDAARAAEYAEAAAALRAELEVSNTVEGPAGRHYLEGVSLINAHDRTREPVAKYQGEYRDFGMRYVGLLIDGGYINLLHHAGEESDTILMPHYSYCAYDAAPYRR